MKLVFVHGWSVTSTETYGDLPQVLEREADESLHVKTFEEAWKNKELVYIYYF